MRIFKNAWFSRFAGKEGITDNELREMVNRLEAGQAANRRFVVNLGGGVYKVRVARSGKGKSGGYRVIVFFRSEERTLFVYGFAKSDRDNIDKRELKVFKERAKIAFSSTDEQIRDRLRTRDLIEVL